MLTVNKDKTRVSVDGNELLVAIDGDDFEELGSPEASNLAFREAGERGFSNVAMRPGNAPYAIDAATGECMIAPFKGKQSGGFRTEITLVKRL